MRSKTIIVTGDPIIDIYIQNKSGVTTSYEEICGGALNVYENVKSILKNCLNGFSKSSLFLPEMKFKTQPYYKILRLNEEKDIHFCKPINKSKFYSSSFLDIRTLDYALSCCTNDSVFVFSDYNKGVLNGLNDNIRYISGKVRCGIVDSKYRSLNLSYLELVEISIWRCTGKEYCSEYAENFDYTIWTDAEKPIKLLDKYQNLIKEISFIPVSCVDSCGAGDTFTAAIACWVYESERKIDANLLIDAINFAVLCSQEVVSIPKTAITTKTLLPK